MSSVGKRLIAVVGLIAVGLVAAACGTQSISVPKSKGALYQGAVLFNQRCSGCHTLSYAATQGSAQNVRTAQYNNGPNFNVRCERPVTRVLYAIENGGFSGAIMPQNVVVGQQAREVAEFVATYAGRQAPKVPGSPTCSSKQVGTIPSPSGAGTAAASSQSSQAAGVQNNAAGPTQSSKHNRSKGKTKQTGGSGQGTGPGG
jgi:mono/diheme cytochrome c family protein